MNDFPLPGMGRPVVAVPAPGVGPGYWAGAPSAVADGTGGFVIGYRVRNGHDGIDQTVIARSPDGERFTTVATLDQERFGAQWMERPAVVRTPEGRWRLFVCCGTPESKHWWIEALEADDPAGLETAEARPAFPGDERTAVKDPIVKLRDGRWHGTVLRGRPGTWDARGARLTCVLPDGRAAYDGRASAEENWFERTGLAVPAADGRFAQVEDSPVVDVRYLDVLPLEEGGH